MPEADPLEVHVARKLPGNPTFEAGSHTPLVIVTGEPLVEQRVELVQTDPEQDCKVAVFPEMDAVPKSVTNEPQALLPPVGTISEDEGADVVPHETSEKD
jgi:hypothetical protein